MSFEKGNTKDGKHYWLTPLDIMDDLQREFQFDYDPCPFPLPSGFNGLKTEWGQSNYVNPPFGAYVDERGKKFGPTAWAKKAIHEYRKGKKVVFVYPPGVANPKFTLEKDGVLWIEGYNIPFHFGGTPIRAMKRFETNLKGYTVIGSYDYAKERIQGDFSELVKDINTDNCIVMVTKSSIEKP